jgi:hypothetical protein
MDIHTTQTNPDSARSNKQVIVMLFCCVLLALITLGGAWYTRPRPRGQAKAQAYLAYCDDPREGWLTPPARARMELEHNCAIQATEEAK